MISEFVLLITYGQILVFNPQPQPFNDWRPEHAAQGFSWREGSVAFGVPDQNGKSAVSVALTPSLPPPRPEAQRAIETPFVATGPEIVVASITEERKVALPAGRYQLRYEMVPPKDLAQDGYAIHLTFAPAGDAQFRILRRDPTPGSEMTSDVVLRRDAAPAR